MGLPLKIMPKAVGHPRVRPWVSDGLLALLLFAFSVVAGFKMTEHPELHTAGVLLAEAAIFSVLVLRTARPQTVLCCTAAGCAALVWHLNGLDTPALLAPAAALSVVAARGNRRVTVIWWGLTSAVIVVSQSIGSGEVFQANQIGTLVWLGFFAAMGEAVQSKKAYVAAIEERAHRAEHTREEEAGRRVAEERLRIAQELHDVVAHHIAVIHVQASVAEHLVKDKPEEAAEALTHVRRSSRTVLDELTGLLNVLRQPGDTKTPIEPAAGVNDLPALIHSFESSGLRVTWTIRGERRPLPPAVDLVAYRLAQEGLTNAHKHGLGSAKLDVRFTGDAVMIDIVNANGVEARPATDDSSLTGGYGLIGMRERALAVGGSLRAAPEPDGTWRVRARLPVRAEKEKKAPVPIPPMPPPDKAAVSCKIPVRPGGLGQREPSRGTA
ncbi:histidine kinase [Kineosporia sp. NBRC 101731]|uniref:sensor histidine kinase n=1 Tax=Kineosporia sp. NBRC 101731 TaxID=3032199 RepID=UPI002552BB7D|nr:histidine kinase [Kineosporia sp. NBRC 101731]